MSTELIVVRQGNEVSATDLEIFRRVLYALTDGMTREHKQRWRRFWNWIVKAGPGEYVTWFQNRTRSSPFHRRHFLIEQRLFDAQERFEDFEQFRNWLKVGAGFVDWHPGPKGGVVPIPKSMSYASLDEDGMQDLHAKMVAFAYTPHALKTMWKHLGEPARAAMVTSVLQEFGE